MAPEPKPPSREFSDPMMFPSHSPSGTHRPVPRTPGRTNTFHTLVSSCGRMLNMMGQEHDTKVNELTDEIKFLRQQIAVLRGRLGEAGGEDFDVLKKNMELTLASETTLEQVIVPSGSSTWRGRIVLNSDPAPAAGKRSEPAPPISSAVEGDAAIAPRAPSPPARQHPPQADGLAANESEAGSEQQGSDPGADDRNVEGHAGRKSLASIGTWRTPRTSAYSSVDGSRSVVCNGAHSMFADEEDDEVALREVIIRRLRMRLGAATDNVPVTGDMLYAAVTSLGLMKYSETDITRFIQELNQVYRETMGAPDPSSKHSWTSRLSNPSLVGTEMWDVVIDRLPWFLRNRFARRMAAQRQSAAVRRRQHGGRSIFGALGGDEEDDDSQISFDRFTMLMLDEQIREHVTPTLKSQMTTVAEVLLSGESNRVIAELTNTRIDDLASPPPKKDALTLIEPVVGFMIVVNGVLIGLQSDVLEDWTGWWYIESLFVVFFIVELVLRVFVSGLRDHFCGVGSAWNIFDFSIILAACVDLCFSVNNNGSTTVLRLFRLTRLSRMLRMLRFRFLRELTLMLKGLMGGFRTLGWAMVLLVSTLYVIALFMYSLLGNDLDSDIENPAEYFSTVPRCMFTCFRCFTGDCVDSRGFALVVLLQRSHGTPFVLAYTMCTMLVTFGIFNLITAIYIEATLTAARHQDEVHRSKRKRESLRVAHTTKRLLKKFCEAQRVFANSWGFGRNNESEILDLHNNTKSSPLSNLIFLGDELQEDLVITKEVFLIVVQDKAVQALMDDLDITPERAHLFDVLDSDGSGGLHVTELVQGLLKVRGEARKSDVIACLLSVRALQDMMRTHKVELEDQIRQVRRQITQQGVSMDCEFEEAAPTRRMRH